MRALNLTRRRGLAALVVLALGAAAAADANHSHQATYTGRISGGGTVEFDVSADGSAVTRVKFADISRGDCTIPETEILVNAPVTNHAFTHQDAAITISGQFTSDRIAQGTASITSAAAPPSPACDSGAMSWSATTTVAPPAPAPPPDTAAPAATVTAAAQQKIGTGAIVVRVTCTSEPCAATGRGTLSVRGSSPFRLGPVTVNAAQGARATIRLKLSKKAKTAVRRALAKRRSASAKVTVTTTDAAGNRSQVTRTVRLRR